jgi:hypothetical protein
MRIDRSDPADEPRDAHRPRPDRSAPGDPGAADKDTDNHRPTVANGDDRADSSLACPDSARRIEEFAAYCNVVGAAYRQYAIDNGNDRMERLEGKTITLAVRRVEGEDPEPHSTRPDNHVRGKDPKSEAIDPKDHETRHSPSDTAVAARDSDLPEGYRSSPALKGDPYHPQTVQARSRGNQELYAATSRDRAAALGYTTRIAAQKAPFDSHGQEVFTNGKTYITPDVDGHNATNGWKMFSRRGVRIGTYDSELNYVKE